MKSSDQLQQSIERFKKSFWGKSSVDRPPVGIVPKAIWLPIRYCKKPLSKPELKASRLTADLAATDYEFAFAKKRVTIDDFLPFNAPWRAVPWVEAMCGCGVHVASGSLAPKPFIRTGAELDSAPIPANTAWLDCMKVQLRLLNASLPADCFLSPTILRGPSDVLAGMRGLTGLFTDLYDHPELLSETAARINQLLMNTLDMHFSIARPKLGGYAHIFGYWAPQPTIAIQEDAMTLCGPEHYNSIFYKHNVELVWHLGPAVFFHLHSTGFMHYPHVLKIPNLAGVQLTVERDGPSLRDMLGDLRAIAESSRLILYVEGYFDELPEVLANLPKEGLYLILPDSFIRNDVEFHDFVNAVW